VIRLGGIDDEFFVAQDPFRSLVCAIIREIESELQFCEQNSTA
jgi:hypothetical protein